MGVLEHGSSHTQYVACVWEMQLTGFLYIGSSLGSLQEFCILSVGNTLREFCSMGVVLRAMRVFSSLSKREAAYRISIHWK